MSAQGLSVSSKRGVMLIALGFLFGALGGTLVGELLSLVLPEGVVREFFLRSVEASVGPTTIDAVMFTVTLGFSVKLNAISLIGIGVAYYFLRWFR